MNACMRALRETGIVIGLAFIGCGALEIITGTRIGCDDNEDDDDDDNEDASLIGYVARKQCTGLNGGIKRQMADSH